MRGCICGPDLAVIALRIEKKGEKEIEGVTDSDKPRRLGPKRANYIRKVFALRKKDDVRKYVVRRKIEKKDKVFYKAPKIQRLITETRLRRKRLFKKSKKEAYTKQKENRAKYDKIMSQYLKEKKALKAHKAEEQVAEPRKEQASKAGEKVAQTKPSPKKAEQAKREEVKKAEVSKGGKQGPAKQEQTKKQEAPKTQTQTQKQAAPAKKGGK